MNPLIERALRIHKKKAHIRRFSNDEIELALSFIDGEVPGAQIAEVVKKAPDNFAIAALRFGLHSGKLDITFNKLKGEK